MPRKMLGFLRQGVALATVRSKKPTGSRQFRLQYRDKIGKELIKKITDVLANESAFIFVADKGSSNAN